MYSVKQHNHLYKKMRTSEIDRLGLQFSCDIINDKSETVSKGRFLNTHSFKDAEAITGYMRTMGKIPSFLEIRKTLDKGYGVFATQEIEDGMFLGFYEGLRIPMKHPINMNTLYNFNVNGFGNNDKVACIMADNLVYSNWTCLINDNFKNNNVEVVSKNHMIMLFASKTIIPDEEIGLSYGTTYWDTYRKAGLEIKNL